MKLPETGQEYAEGIVNTIREALIVLDQELRVISASRSFYQQFQMTPGKTEGRLIYELGNHQWDIPRLRELLEEIIPVQTTIEGYEVKHHFERIGEKVLMLNACRLERNNGKAGITILAIEDITEWYITRHKLAESEEKSRKIVDITGLSAAQKKVGENSTQQKNEFRNERDLLQQIVNNLPYSFVLYNPDLKIEYTNKTVMKRFGFSVEMVQGKTVPELFSREISEIYVPLLQKVRDTGKPFTGEVSYHVGGNLVTNIPNIVPLFNERNEIHHLLVLSIDITDLKRIENALRENETGLKRAQEIAHLGSWELDLVSNRLTWSDEIYRIFGLNPQEFGATYEAFLDHVHPDDREAVNAAYTRSLEENRDYYEVDHRVIRKINGEIRYVHEKCEHVRDANGKIIRSLGMVHDITDRKKIENALLRQTEELAAAYSELESFSSSVSHDLRSPLMAMKGFTDIFMKDNGDKLDDHAKVIFKYIVNAIEKMASIIEDLLSLARITKEKMNCMEIDLSQIAHRIVNDLRQTGPERTVQVNIANALPTYADQRYATITLENLLGNAWKYTGKNPDARIDVGVIRENNEDVFFIRDNGAGFDMNFAHKLFQPFQRLHSESDFAGTGIGLAIVHRIIQRHGGRIWAESKVNKGSTFYFTLNCRKV